MVTEKQGKKYKIVIVDDFKTQRQFTISSIQSLNLPITFIECENGKQALDHLNEDFESTIGVVTDYEMPVMDGLELISNIRKKWSRSELPVGLITSKGEIVNDFKKYDYNFAIKKPFEKQELAKVVNECIVHKLEQKKVQICLVNNDIVHASMWESFFKMPNYVFHKATHAKEALFMARKTKYEAFVAKYVLPDIDGFRLLKKIASEPDYSQIPMFLIANKNELDEKLISSFNHHNIHLIDETRIHTTKELFRK